MKRLLQILRPAWLSVSLVIVLTFFQSLTTLYLPRLMADIVDYGVIKANMSYIYRIGAWMLAVTILSAIFSVIAGFIASKTSAEFGQVLRNRVFRHAESMMPHEFDQLGTSSLIVRSTNDVMQVQQFINMLLRMMVIAPLMALGGIIMAVTTNWQLSWILFLILPVLALVVWGILRHGMALFQLMQDKVDVLNRVVRENLTGIRIIRAFGREDYEISRFAGANGTLTDVAIRVNTLMAVLMPLVMLVVNLSTVAILWFGGHEVGSNTLQVGKLMAFIQYVTQILFSTMMVSAMFFMLPRSQASARRINEILDFTPALKDNPSQESVPVSTLSHALLQFHDVSFQYPGAKSAVLSNVSFDVNPGSITAIIGGTGSGKTALLNLIPRFFDISCGVIKLSGIDIQSLPQQLLRSYVAYVPQKSVVFSGSIADNIRFGNPEATDEEIHKAAQIAQAIEFIENLPGQFDFVVQQAGTNLSGGQKQRLAIARALVKRARLYLFDDSFSALDYQTERRLLEALKDSLHDSAVILVSQRVHTVIDANPILVLDGGHIAGMGTHEQLMKDSFVYQDIVRTQLSREASA